MLAYRIWQVKGKVDFRGRPTLTIFWVSRKTRPLRVDFVFILTVGGGARSLAASHWSAEPRRSPRMFLQVPELGGNNWGTSRCPQVSPNVSTRRLALRGQRPANHPWLTAEAYSTKIQPLLIHVSTSTIASRVGVSRWYAGKVRQGYHPHPRHWQALGQLVGISSDGQTNRHFDIPWLAKAGASAGDTH